MILKRYLFSDLLNVFWFLLHKTFLAHAVMKCPVSFDCFPLDHILKT